MHSADSGQLSGSLPSFALPDVLTLLHGTGKTGLLDVTDGAGATGHLGLVDGAVAFAVGAGESSPLLRLLVGAGLVDATALRALLGGGRARPRSAVAALITDGTVSAHDVRALAQDLAIDTVSRLLSWTAGSFEFRLTDAAAADPDDVGLRLAASDVLTAAAGRSELWPQLTAVLPRPDLVLSVATPPGAGDDVRCTRREWSLLALVDGTRTVRDVLELSGQPESSAAQLLAELVRRGLLQVGEPGGDAGIGGLLARYRLVAEVEAAFRRTEAGAPTTAGSVPLSAPLPIPAPAAAVPTVAPPAPLAPPSPRVPVPAAELPVQRSTPAPVPPAAPVSGGGAVPLTAGTSALAPRADQQGTDAAVTRALVLRLIAGVQEL
ncbi:MAG TPA: DUF4388 domain-containing protein [Frankiaceae bacterium]